MELVFGLVLLVLVLAALDYSAMRWGVNSRSSSSDWRGQTDYDFYEESTPGIV